LQVTVRVCPIPELLAPSSPDTLSSLSFVFLCLLGLCDILNCACNRTVSAGPDLPLFLLCARPFCPWFFVQFYFGRTVCVLWVLQVTLHYFSPCGCPHIKSFSFASFLLPFFFFFFWLGSIVFFSPFFIYLPLWLSFFPVNPSCLLCQLFLVSPDAVFMAVLTFHDF